MKDPKNERKSTKTGRKTGKRQQKNNNNNLNKFLQERLSEFPSHYEVKSEKLRNVVLNLSVFLLGMQNLFESYFPVCVHSGDGDQREEKRVRRSRRGSEEKEPVMSNLGKSL